MALVFSCSNNAAPIHRWARRAPIGLFMVLFLAACDGGPQVRRADESRPAVAKQSRPDADVEAIDGNALDLPPDEARRRPAETDGAATAATPSSAQEGKPGDQKSIVNEPDEVDGPTDEPDNTAQRLDLEELVIDDAPPLQRDLSPALAAALDRTRVAMQNRSFFDARRELQAAPGHLV